jgi:ABC-type transporter Mla MlaB component
MTVSEEDAHNEAPLLEIELMEISHDCLARLSGDLVAETRAGLWSIEPMLANEARVALDVSGVTSIDGPGLEAALRLMHAVHAFGGTVTLGSERCSRKVSLEAPVSAPYDAASGVLGRLNVLRVSTDYQVPFW